MQQSNSIVKVCSQCRHNIFSRLPSFPDLIPRQTAFQEAHPTMKGRVHLGVNSFAGSPVSKPQSSYWVPETLHSTKPHSDLSDPYSSARYWVSLSRGWSSSQTESQPAVLPCLWGFFGSALVLECCSFFDWFTVFCQTRGLEIFDPFIWVSLPSGLSGRILVYTGL